MSARRYCLCADRMDLVRVDADELGAEVPLRDLATGPTSGATAILLLSPTAIDELVPRLLEIRARFTTDDEEETTARKDSPA